eukprot:11078322-Alexandrium_andersonii.AAC.1
MSASLVGSEMCIRDSFSSVSDLRYAKGTPIPKPHVQVCKIPLHSSESVSYTHLTLPTICSV